MVGWECLLAGHAGRCSGGVGLRWLGLPGWGWLVSLAMRGRIRALLMMRVRALVTRLPVMLVTLITLSAGRIFVPQWSP